MFNFIHGYTAGAIRQVVLISDDVTYEVMVGARYPIQGMPSFTVVVDVLDSATNRWVYSHLSKQWDSGKVTLLEMENSRV